MDGWMDTLPSKRWPDTQGYPSKVMMVPGKPPSLMPLRQWDHPKPTPTPCAKTHPSSIGLGLSGHSLNQPSSCPAASSPCTLNTTWEGKAGEGWACSWAGPQQHWKGLGLTLPRKSFLPTRSQSHTSTQSFSPAGSASSNSKVSFQRG